MFAVYKVSVLCSGQSMEFQTSFYQKIRNGIPRWIQAQLQERARKQLMKHEALWQVVADNIEKSNSTGCAYTDYLALYEYVRRYKPTEILECGSGISTVVLAYAVKENESEGMPRGRVTTMEEIPLYHEMVKTLCPDELRPYIDFRLSDIMLDGHSFIRGMRYREVPERPYTFVFIDGPRFISDDGTHTCDFDLVRVVERSTESVYAFVDRRHTTVFAMQALFGIDKVRFDYVREIGFIGPCSAKDLEPKAQVSHRLACWRPTPRLWFFQKPFNHKIKE